MDNYVTLGGFQIPLKDPQSMLVESDLVSATNTPGVNQERLFCAALGFCWDGPRAIEEGKDLPAQEQKGLIKIGRRLKSSFEKANYSVLGYGGSVMLEMQARGLKREEILDAAVAAYNLALAERLKGLQARMAFTEPSGEE